MRVECVENRIAQIAPNTPIGEELRRSVGPNTSLLDLSVGTSYVVYAIEIINGNLRYVVADDVCEALWYPISYLSAVFRMQDSRVSRCWRIGFKNRTDAKTGDTLFGFKEWVEEDFFHERLIDGGDRERAIFEVYKTFMDMEFPSTSVTSKAQLLEGFWVMCPQCSEAWESESELGLISCPKCRIVVLNPRYAPRDPYTN